MSSLRFATNYSPETGKLAPRSDTCAGTKPRGMTLCIAAKAGDLKEAKAILHNDLKSVNKSDGSGWTPLHHASKHGQDSMVKLLLSNGADIHARTNRQKDTALILAVKYKHESVVECLLGKGARVDDVADPNQALHGAADPITALHHAADRKHTAIVELLLGKGANPNLVDPSGFTPLSIAASKKNIDEMELLIGFGGTTDGLEKADDNVKRKVHSAVQDVSGNVDLRDLRNRVHWAIGKGLVSVVKRLLDTDSELLESDSHYRKGWRPLHRASREGNVELVKLLLQHGADINCLTQGRWTPLLLASERRRCAGVIEVLVKNKADATKKTSGGRGAVYLARKNKQSEKIMNMIEGLARSQVARDGKHASTEVVEDDGCTPSPISTPSSATPEINKVAPGPDTFPPEVPHDEPVGSTEMFSHAVKLESNLRFHTIFSLENGGGLLTKAYERSVQSDWDQWLRSFDTFRSGILPNVVDWENEGRVRVTVIDTGIDGEHQYFRSRWSTTTTDHKPLFCDFVKPDATERKLDPVDLDGHGTFIAGILLQVAPDIELSVARIGETQDTIKNDAQIGDKVGRAIEHAIDNWDTQIISISFGSERTSPKVEEAIERARRKNVIILAASGNHGNLGNMPYPAKHHDVFRIFATSFNGNATDFSHSFGHDSYQNYSVIGDGIQSAWPLFTLCKLNPEKNKIFYPTYKDRYGKVVGKRDPWTIMSGTSFATPIAAAMVAIIYQFYDVNENLPSKVKLGVGNKDRFKTPQAIRAIFNKLSRCSHSVPYRVLDLEGSCSKFDKDIHETRAQLFSNKLSEILNAAL